MRTTSAGPGQTKLRDTIEQLHAVNPTEFALPDDSVTDGEGKELSLMVGVNSGDGRGNLTAYATVFDSEAVLQADRDYSACTVNPNPVGSFTCGGSSTNAGGRFSDFSNYDFTVDTPTAFRAYNADTDLYNFGPLNYYQRPERRYSLGAMGHYEFGEHADVYTQLMFSDYESIAQIAPSGNFFSTSTINCDNPFLPSANLADIGCGRAEIAAGTDVTMYIGRRNVEGGGRQQAFANTLIPGGRRRPRVDQRGVGLRRFGAVLERRSQHRHAELLCRHSDEERPRRHRRQRRPDLPVVYRRH